MCSGHCERKGTQRIETVVDMETEKDLNLKWTRAKMGEAIKTGGYQQVAGLIF